MNKLKCKLMIVLAFLLATMPLPIASVALVGCTGGCASVDKGADLEVVRAEQFYRGADKLMRSFTTFEFNNRAKLNAIDPNIEKAANTVRIDGFDALVKVQESVVKYKANRTPENREGIGKAIAIAEGLESLADGWFNKIKL